MSTPNPTILTLFFNEGETDYSKESIEHVIELINKKNPDILFIGNQESLIDIKTSFVQKIIDELKNNYESKGTEIGGSYRTILRILSVVAKKNKNVRSTLLIKIKKGLTVQNVNFKKIGSECGLASLDPQKGTGYKDSILLTFEYNGIKYCIVNSHLSFSDKTENQNLGRRSEQLICLLKEVSKYFKYYNIIFGGDLNFRLSAKDYLNNLKKSNSAKYNAKKYLTDTSIHNFNNYLTTFKNIDTTSFNNNERFIRFFDKIMKKIIRSKFPKLKNKEDINLKYNQIYNILKGFDVKDKIIYLLDFYNNDNKSAILQFIESKNGPKRGFRVNDKVIKTTDDSKKIIKGINSNKITFNNDTIAIKNSNIKLNLKSNEMIKQELNNFFKDSNNSEHNSNKLLAANELFRLLTKKQSEFGKIEIENKSDIFLLINTFINNLKQTPFYFTCKYEEEHNKIQSIVEKKKGIMSRIRSSLDLKKVSNNNNSNTGTTISSTNNNASVSSRNSGSSNSSTKKITYRMPSMCDRILYSFLKASTIQPIHTIKIDVLERSKLLYSDHLLIYAEIYTTKYIPQVLPPPPRLPLKLEGFTPIRQAQNSVASTNEKY